MIEAVVSFPYCSKLRMNGLWRVYKKGNASEIQPTMQRYIIIGSSKNPKLGRAFSLARVNHRDLP